MRSLKVGVAFYCLIRLIEPITNVPAIQEKNSAKQTVVVVKNGVVFGLQNGAEKIFDSNETIGVRWHDFLVEIAVDTIASRNSLPDINTDLLAIQDKNGVMRYFKIVSTNQIDLETIECTIEDISEIINHLRLSLKRQMELVELSRRKISDEIRDDMGALISVGKMLIERIVSNDIQQIPDENQPAQSSIFVLLEKAYNRLKAISNKIYPSVIGQFGLEAAMTQFIGKNGEQKPLKIQLQVSPKGFRTDETTEISIYRIFEEAVWFALKVEAAEVSIYLDGHSNLLKFRVIVYMHNKIRNIPETIDALMEFKKSVEVKLFVIKGKLLSDIINEKMFTFDFRILV
jgi:signal transduction histidine kinase